ncbi:MAG: DNA polymerase III subunit delta' [Proteobacteria bacterium]|nr:DNA polymerase III subunit delta' [Pseudomonadota bacterium]
MSEETAVPGPEATPYLVGHHGAEDSFLRAYQSGRMPHAWLITGPRGIGKATLAFRMTRFLLSHGLMAPTAEPAGAGLFGDEPAPAAAPELADLDIPVDHPIFRRVRELSHSDLRVLRRTVNEKTGKLRAEITIDEVRGAIDFLHMTPGESHWRVLVVDSADELNRNAANALLKILEEPRPRTVILLTSHAPGRLLPTIRSRCRKLALEPLPTEAVIAELKRHGVDLGSTELALCTALAEGSVGRAIEFGSDSSGLDLFQSMAQLLSTWPNYDPNILHRLGDKLAGKGGEGQFEIAVSLLDWWLTRFIRWSAVQDPQMPEVFPGESGLMRRLMGAASLDHWLQSWEKVTRLFARVASANLDRKQAWVTAWLVLASPGR